MELNTQEFEVLATMINDRRIETLEREIESQGQLIETLKRENEKLHEHMDLMQREYENLRFENHWMKQYILLSVERVKSFFSHMRNIELLSAVKTFVLSVLPENASAEQIAYASKMMEVPMDEPEQPRVVNNFNAPVGQQVSHVNQVNVNNEWERRFKE